MTAAAVLVTAVVAGIRADLQQERTKARNDLVAFASLVKPGDSRDDVLAAFKSRRFEYLSLRRDDPTAWRVVTPSEFGATDWRLVIAFENQGKVAAIGFRTADSERRRPARSPEDAVAPDYATDWRTTFGSLD